MPETGFHKEQFVSNTENVEAAEVDLSAELAEAQNNEQELAKDDGKFFSKLSSVRSKLKKMGPWLVLMGASLFAAERAEIVNTGSYQNKSRAQAEMVDQDITTEQQRVYKKGLSELTYQAIDPVGYPENSTERTERWQQASENLAHMSDGNLRYSTRDAQSSNYTSKEDAWRLYLGLPERFNTFGISDYKPNNSKEDIYYYKVNNFPRVLARLFEQYRNEPKNESVRGIFITTLKAASEHGDYAWNEAVDKSPANEFRSSNWQTPLYGWALSRFEADLSESDKAILAFANKRAGLDLGHVDSVLCIDSGELNVLGAFTMSIGKDGKGYYMSYFDLWDLKNNPRENKVAGIGGALPIYDRIYMNYNSKEKRIEFIDHPDALQNYKSPRKVTENDFEIHQ